MEILTVIAIIGVTLTSLLGLVSFSLEISTLNKQTTQADIAAREAMEAVRNFRENTTWETDGIGIMSTSTDYHPQVSSSTLKWVLVSGTESVGIFTKKIAFTNVQRDGSDNIVESGGTNDPDTKKITVTVSWTEKGRDHQMKLTSYLTNWK